VDVGFGEAPQVLLTAAAHTVDVVAGRPACPLVSSVTDPYDSGSSPAEPQREKVCQDAVNESYCIAVANVGTDELRPDGKGYTWLPANYSSKP